MSKNSPRLARGLSTLIVRHEPVSTVPGPDNGRRTPDVRHIPISQIRAGTQQPRKTFNQASIESLAQSIRASGILQPILVRPAEGDRYELIAGERRWRAAQAANLEQIPAIIRPVTDSEAVELALVENLQREDLQPLERAGAYKQYMESFGVTADELARRIGESRANISNYLRILRLSDEIRKLIETGELGMGQARAVAGIDDQRRQLAIARLAARRNLAVRQVEALAREAGDSARATPEEPAKRPPHLNEVEEALSRALGLSVKLYPGKKKNSGRVVILYRTLEDFDRIAERINGENVLE